MCLRLLLVSASALLLPDVASAGPEHFEYPRLVSIYGYEDHAMEPFLSADGQWLYFNSRNQPGDETDIHLARRIDDETFQYKGRLEGVNTDALDAAPSIDRFGRFYFVSNRNYDETRNMLWTGTIRDNKVSDVRQVDGDLVRYKPLWMNMDSVISADGNTLYITENHWRLFGGGMDSSDILAARRAPDGRFVHSDELDGIFDRINTDKLEYSPSLTPDELTLYFTRTDPKAVDSGAADAYGIYVATRKTRQEPFGEAKRIMTIQGIVEGPSISPDGCSLFFHQKVGQALRIMRAEKTGCKPK